MKIGFFITARLKSTRLKRKILLDLEGRSVLGHVIESAKQVDGVDDVVVCTSTVAQDRPILDVCNKHGCYYFIGSPADVLHRTLALDVAPVLAAETFVLSASHFIESL